MNTPHTATPETEMTLQEQLIAAHRRIGIEHTEMQVQRDRALAAEARVKKAELERSICEDNAFALQSRVKELEAANTAFQRSKEWYEREAIRQTAAKEDYERQLRVCIRV